MCFNTLKWWHVCCLYQKWLVNKCIVLQAYDTIYFHHIFFVKKRNQARERKWTSSQLIELKEKIECNTFLGKIKLKNGVESFNYNSSFSNQNERKIDRERESLFPSRDVRLYFAFANGSHVAIKWKRERKSRATKNTRNFPFSFSSLIYLLKTRIYMQYTVQLWPMSFSNTYITRLL